MKDAFALEFEKTLERINWPRKEIDLTAQLEKSWTAGVEKLLDLQEPYVLVSYIYLISSRRMVSCMVWQALGDLAQHYGQCIFPFYPLLDIQVALRV